MRLISLVWQFAISIGANPTLQIPIAEPTLHVSIPNNCEETKPASPAYKGTSMYCTITSDDIEREYRIYIPVQYDASSSTPLIISYHGSGKDMLNQELLSQFSNETINPSMIAVYPNGARDENGKRVWQGPTYANPNISDKVFTSNLIADVTSNFNINTAAIFGTGKSNGGGFLDTLACSPNHGGDFAAFAPVAGAFYTDVGTQPCHPANDYVPILEFHGLNDTTIPYAGNETGNGGPLPPIPYWLELWAARNKCVEPPTMTVLIPGEVRNVTHISYECGGVQGLVQHYRIGGMGHDWPSTRINSDNKHHDGPTLIDASPLIMAFFNETMEQGSRYRSRRGQAGPAYI